jgi:hypothetical protein
MAWMGGAVMAAGLAIGGPAHAQAVHSAAAQKADDGVKQNNGQGNGQVASVNPATGQVQAPTPDEAAILASMQRMLSRDTTALQPVYGANGMISIDLQGTFMNVAMATIDEDGNVVHSCVSHERELREWLAAKRGAAKVVPTSAAPTAEVK